ncbi:6-phosphofructokinase [Kocuria palustris]|jgi:phosphofructokinase-like protein|uniref:6-phosphofructokinase n=1 Tax=Kocuria TaxID=57493 RepID=UPI00077B746E|nr:MULTISPECIES: 6-phosphofructokinase [Kocuria]MBM7822543.1 6-phosphofructokinase 1 [Kocuria palustris]MBN6752872.1 6-phosphofructokinase [Kocuria palustris]MBN6757827.1 6-phosphofructokinase [Kocuria palustris]MBN6762855.1 6-phosphofructokinase [Kocuria palustris]MBN6782337.1 6-phosphofructokinase [Kocuria palustris]
MKIGLLTSGGDCPGLNAVIRAAVLHGIKSYDHEFVGFRDGWRGLVEGDIIDLPRTKVRGLARQGGTILGTSRTNPYDHPQGGPENISIMLERHGIDAVVAIGGEGTLAGARRLALDGLPVVGVPKTIDNDLMGTDYTFGFDTAVSIATDSMDRLRTTGESHHRCMVAEVMGRHVGWIALHSGMAAGAHAVLIPEQRTSMDEVCRWVTEVHERGRSPLVVVAEGFIPEGFDDVTAVHGTEADGRPRLGGIGEYITQQIEERTGIETRNTILGHIQRGGAPTGYDRVLATRFGMSVVDLIQQKKWGYMVALRGTDMVPVSFDEALTGLKTVPQDRWDEAKVLFGR